MYDVKSLSIGHESELFVLNGNRIHVWDARDTNSGTEHVDRLLGGADALAVSADGAALSTWNEPMKRVEIRDVCDVSKRFDRVDCSFTISPQFGPNPQIFALSSDRKVVAFAQSSSSVAHLGGGRRGNPLHSLSNLDDRASGLTPSEQGLRSRSGYLKRGGLRGEIESLSFSPDGTIVSAVVVVRATWDNSPLMKKSYSWNVSSGWMSGNPLGETHSSSETNTTANRSAVARLTCKQLSTSLGLLYSKNVTCEHEAKSFTIATLEKAVKCAHYCSNTSRLWLSLRPRSLHYVDLIADNNQLALRNEPPLPCLSQPCPTASQDRATHTTERTEAEEVYDVFISHAGTDKLSIAEPLYELLVALGLKVFLDRAELRPGQNASQKMINAMRTAKIAVVILSPEFAARKWTMKELMCFMKRFGADGERGVIVIPVFYRLGLDDCRDENTLFGVVDENAQSAFIKEGFLQRMAAEREYCIGDVLKALQSLRSVTGIENKDGVTNGTSTEEKTRQRAFVKTIAAAVVEAKLRLESGCAAGPSG